MFDCVLRAIGLKSSAPPIYTATLPNPFRLKVDRSVRDAPNGEGRINPQINSIKLVNAACPIDWWREIEEAAIVAHYSETADPFG